MARQAIEVYLREEDAQRELEEILDDEPQWWGMLRVEEIDLSLDRTSMN